jgi:hypothetical protein
MIEAAIIFMIFFSSTASYLLALQFHLSIERAGTGRLYGPKVLISGAILLLHVLTFVASRIAFATLLEASNLMAVSSYLFGAYKIAISVYFVWGHWKAYKIFKMTENSVKEKGTQTFQLGRRMALISASNFISLIFVILFTTPLFFHNHGSHMLITCFMFQGLTTLLEVMAVPTLKTRAETLGRSENSFEIALSNLTKQARALIPAIKSSKVQASDNSKVELKNQVSSSVI